jgi:hypothetical protein
MRFRINGDVYHGVGMAGDCGGEEPIPEELVQRRCTLASWDPVEG